jgi:hypothetical protein
VGRSLKIPVMGTKVYRLSGEGDMNIQSILDSKGDGVCAQESRQSVLSVQRQLVSVFPE